MQRKVRRVVCYEDKNSNSFRQHINDIKNFLLVEIENKNSDNKQCKKNDIAEFLIVGEVVMIYNTNVATLWQQENSKSK